MVAERLASVQARIEAAARRAGRTSEAVTLICVTKGASLEAVEEVVTAGVQHLGENRVQEMRSKQIGLSQFVGQWHLIGHLQRNKVRAALQSCSWFHALDRAPLGAAIQRAADEQAQPLPVLIQVNVAGEAAKHGVSTKHVRKLLQATASMTGFKVVGLMTIPPRAQNSEESRPWYSALASLQQTLRDEGWTDLVELSMGMSQDFEVAVEEGASMVRIGRAIFSAT